MPEVPIKKVSWPSREAFIHEVYEAALRQQLRPESAVLLVAHVSLSTGWGRAADNYRLAGIKATKEYQSYTVVTGFEYKDGVKQPGHHMKWRSFETLDEGMEAFVGLLRNKRYAKSLALLLAGDPEYFAQVGRDGWYTAPVAIVRAGMMSRLKVIKQTLGMA